MTQIIYVKFDGGRLTPAPKRVLKTGGVLIEDYNAENNSEMLLTDGYKAIPYSDYEKYINHELMPDEVGNLVENPDYPAIKSEREKQNKIIELQAKINELDLKSIRALREGGEKEPGLTWFDYYTEQIQDLRQQIQEL